MARLPTLLLLGVFAAAITPLSSQSPSSGKPSINNGEWPDYSGDLRGWRYSPLDHINASNFNQLQVAWRFKTDVFGIRPDFNLQTTPLMINGVLYATVGHRRDAVAIDAATGERFRGFGIARRVAGLNRRERRCAGAGSRDAA